MIRREEIIKEELITKDQKLKDCILIDCKVEEGALIQTSKFIVDGKLVSSDCDCLTEVTITGEFLLEEDEDQLEEDLFNKSFGVVD